MAAYDPATGHLLIMTNIHRIGRFRFHSSILALLINVVFICALYLFLARITGTMVLPTNDSLIRLDAEWYEIIKNNGYYYNEGQRGPMAFFPLFPGVWSITTLNAIGISLLNYTFFCIAFYILASHLEFDLKTSLLFLSTPSLFFCYIPYSEALFFLGTVILLIGLHKKDLRMIVAGLTIAAFTRSIGMVFIGAILFVYLINILSFPIEVKKLAKWAILMCLLTGGITLAVFFIQYLYTGEWFVFFKVQNAWQRTIQLPTLPFTTLNDSRVLWLDGLALLVCLYALVLCCRYIILAAAKKNTSEMALLFSAAYLAIVGLLTIFYNGVWPGFEGTTLMSINRFVFSTPFFIYFAGRLLLSKGDKKYLLIILFFLTILTWLLLGAYKPLPGHENYMTTLTYFTNLSAYVLLYALLPRYRFSYFLLYVINSFLQIDLFNAYLHNQWVG